MLKRKTKTKKKGRPIKEGLIDWDEFDRLCRIQCTQVEIAAWFNCSIETISNAVKRDKGMLFEEYYKQKKGFGRISLRRSQMRLAEGGNPAMLIWMGKQWLGQKDNINLEHTGPEGGPIQVTAVKLESLTIEERQKLRDIVAKSSGNKQIAG